MEGVFHQLAECLAAFSGETDLMLESSATGSSTQALRTWLQPNARCAEAAMHRLRELRLTQMPAATELSQSLTVLVLAADMLVQGHLCGDNLLESYALMRRNADRAIKSLSELQAQFCVAEQQSDAPSQPQTGDYQADLVGGS